MNPKEYRVTLSLSACGPVLVDELRIPSGSGAEFMEEAAHYESDVPGLGSRFADEVDRVIKLLHENPKIGAPVDEELRHFVLRRFPHSIVYAIIGQRLFIIAVAHGSRKPGYWRSRTGR